MKKTLLAITACVLLFGACKKDDNNPSPDASSILTTGSWQITSSVSVIEYPSPAGTQTVDIYALAQDCIKDNTFKLNANGTITTDEGATKCDPNDPQTFTEGTWQLSNNDTKMKIDDGTSNVDADLVSVNNSSFTLRYVTYANNIKSTTTSSYKHLP